MKDFKFLISPLLFPLTATSTCRNNLLGTISAFQQKRNGVDFFGLPTQTNMKLIRRFVKKDNNWVDWNPRCWWKTSACVVLELSRCAALHNSPTLPSPVSSHCLIKAHLNSVLFVFSSSFCGGYFYQSLRTLLDQTCHTHFRLCAQDAKWNRFLKDASEPLSIYQHVIHWCIAPSSYLLHIQWWGGQIGPQYQEIIVVCSTFAWYIQLKM